ncbi:MAG: protein kinase, partial [Planctomycetota bacterium]
EAERQALAMMDHPNIAKVYDAGKTDDGDPYFVMELVNGCSIHDYCDQAKLSTSSRLSLFADVCRALQHSHQKGIIHRDLKPSNILVAEYDGQPVPKVIDFGVAKATGTQLTDRTLFTEFGQIIGTIEYMSPEQSRRNQLDVDTRSDIYSLGIVLYKLLTGDTPFGSDRFRNAAWDEVFRIIREEEPALPSIKVSSSQTLARLAERRAVEPKRLSAQIRGDLDWIVTKSLEKDRGRRYQSAGEFSDDIQRHLNQLPVLAAPQNVVTRYRKWFKRNRNTVLWSALVMVAVYSSFFAIYRQYKLRRAETERLDALVVEVRRSMTNASNAPVGDEFAWEVAKTQLSRLEDARDRGQGNDEEVLNRVDQTIRDFQKQWAEHAISIQIEEVVLRGASDHSLASWQQMERQIKDLFDEFGFDLDVEKPEVVGRRIRESDLAVRWSDLLELWIGTRANFKALGGEEVTEAQLRPWLEALYVADPDPVRTSIRKFIQQRPPAESRLASFAGDVDLDQLSPRTLSWFASCYGSIGDFQRVNEIYQRGLDLHPQDVMMTHDFALVLSFQKDYERSARMYHRCLALRPDVAGLWFSLAETLEKLGETEAAVRARNKGNRLPSRRPSL